MGYLGSSAPTAIKVRHIAFSPFWIFLKNLLLRISPKLLVLSSPNLVRIIYRGFWPTVIQGILLNQMIWALWSKKIQWQSWQTGGKPISQKHFYVSTVNLVDWLKTMPKWSPDPTQRELFVITLHIFGLNSWLLFEVMRFKILRSGHVAISCSMNIFNAKAAMFILASFCSINMKLANLLRVHTAIPLTKWHDVSVATMPCWA